MEITKEMLRKASIEDLKSLAKIIEIDKRFKGNEVYETYRKFKGRYAVLVGGSGCVDKDTEYFNGTQWKPINQYKDGEKVLQYKKDGTTELVAPFKFHKYNCTTLTHFKTFYGVDQCLSDEHNVVYITSKGNLAKKPFSELKSQHINSKKGFNGRFITTFNYSGRGIDLTDDEIRLMVAVIADGSFQKGSLRPRCRFNFKKDRKKKRLEELLQRLGYEYTKTKSVADGYHFYYVNVPRKEKEFTEYWYNCNQEQLKVIIDEVLYWDGYQNGTSKRFASSIKSNADFVQFAFSACGYRATISTDNRIGDVQKVDNKEYIRKSSSYEVIISNNKLVSIQNLENKVEMKEYKTLDGYKYCFTVPSGMLVLRRNNRIFITGNSGKSYEVADKHIKRLVEEDNHRMLCVRAQRNQVTESQFPLLESRLKFLYKEAYEEGKFKINTAQGSERIEFPEKGNEIIFAGLDDVDKLRSIFDITSIWVNN